MKISRVFTAVLALLMTVAAGVIFGSGAAVASPKPTVVLVHGAFADATSWDGVAADLRSRGYRVVAPDNPLRGPAYDASVIEKTVADIDGPVVLVGHSYGGAVITNVHDPKVQSLVYIAAFAPVQGEPVQITIDPIRFPGSQLLPPALGFEDRRRSSRDRREERRRLRHGRVFPFRLRSGCFRRDSGNDVGASEVCGFVGEPRARRATVVGEHTELVSGCR